MSDSRRPLVQPARVLLARVRLARVRLARVQLHQPGRAAALIGVLVVFGLLAATMTVMLGTRTSDRSAPRTVAAFTMTSPAGADPVQDPVFAGTGHLGAHVTIVADGHPACHATVQPDGWHCLPARPLPAGPTTITAGETVTTISATRAPGAESVRITAAVMIGASAPAQPLLLTVVSGVIPALAALTLAAFTVPGRRADRRHRSGSPDRRPWPS